MEKLVYLEDYYYAPDGDMIFTESYHIKRGICCGSDCLHCPFDGITEVDGNSKSTDTEIKCSFCFEVFSIPIFKEEGIEQQFVYDCEICCRPIDIQISFSEGERPKLIIGR